MLHNQRILITLPYLGTFLRVMPERNCTLAIGTSTLDVPGTATEMAGAFVNETYHLTLSGCLAWLEVPEVGTLG